jgi:hypothetical protein
VEYLKRRNALRAQYDALDAAGEDFKAIAAVALGLQLQASETGRLTEKDYLTLADRHAALVQRVTERCKELTKAREFAAVTTLGTQLSALKAVVLPIVDKSLVFDHPTGMSSSMQEHSSLQSLWLTRITLMAVYSYHR